MKMNDITLDGIIDKFEASTLSELDVAYKDLHVICKRYSTSPSNESGITEYKAPLEKKEVKKQTPCKDNKKDDFKTINAPLVGTFYCSSSPDSPAFVKPGDKVVKGETLCILEAMKMMNELTAEGDCTIEEILAPQGGLVEYGQPLFKVSCNG
jgi:acetyl-CoA carboxylase biotin carboxyl carrier protein